MITIVSKSKLVEVTIPFKKNLDRTERMEAASKAVKEQKTKQFSVNAEQWINGYGAEALADLVQGMMLSSYELAFPIRFWNRLKKS
mgnify:CR=1 FL=1